MAEHSKPMAAHQVDYTCDACGTGKMRSTGMVLASSPAQYPHRCTECHAARTFLKQYP